MGTDMIKRSAHTGEVRPIKRAIVPMLQAIAQKARIRPRTVMGNERRMRVTASPVVARQAVDSCATCVHR